jgi:hypothetical protein
VAAYERQENKKRNEESRWVWWCSEEDREFKASLGKALSQNKEKQKKEGREEGRRERVRGRREGVRGGRE